MKKDYIDYLRPYSDISVNPIETMGLNVPVIIGLTILLFACMYLLIKINLPKTKKQ